MFSYIDCLITAPVLVLLCLLLLPILLHKWKGSEQRSDESFVCYCRLFDNTAPDAKHYNNTHHIIWRASPNLDFNNGRAAQLPAVWNGVHSQSCGHIRWKLVMQINSLTSTASSRPSERPAAFLTFAIIAFVSPRLTRFVAYHLAGFVAHHLAWVGFVIYRRRGVNGGNKAIVLGQPACGGRHN